MLGRAERRGIRRIVEVRGGDEVAAALRRRALGRRRIARAVRSPHWWRASCAAASATCCRFSLAMWIGEAIWLSLRRLRPCRGGSDLPPRLHRAEVGGRRLSRSTSPGRCGRAAGAEVAPCPTRAPAWRLFGAGLAVTLGNPKIMVFYLALLPSHHRSRARRPRRLGRAHRGHGGVLVAIDLAWVLAAAQARRLLKSPRAVRMANRLSAGTMAGAAAAIAARSS